MSSKSLARTVASVALFALAACHHYTGVVPAPDITTTKTSEHGLYRAAVHPTTTPIPVGKLQAWTLHVETVAGAPVDSASIFVDGGMPQHGHGLPTRPRVTTALGNGDHTVEGLKFSMGGWWRMIFVVRTGAGVDTVVFNAAL
ncbi:MAG: FixH family protein [bacterium]